MRNSVILQTEVDKVRRDVERRIGARAQVHLQLEAELEKRDRLSEEVEVLDLTQQLALALEGAWRKTFEQTLEDVVSEGLTLVMGREFFLHIKSTTKNNASAVTFTVETEHGITPVVGSHGGSVGQIVSFLLRLMVLLSHRPALRRILVIDEAFSGVSEENVPHVARLLRKLVDETGVQVFFITQNRQYIDAADVAIDVRDGAKHSTVVVLKNEKDEAA